MSRSKLEGGEDANTDPASRSAALDGFLPLGVPLAAVILRLRNRTLVRVLAARREEDADGQR